MNCPECIEQMAALAAGSLDEAAAVPVRAHLAACPDCQREYATLTRTLEKLDALPARPPSHRMRAALAGMIETEKLGQRDQAPFAASLRREADRPRRRAWLPAVLQMLGVAAVLAIGLLVGEREGEHKAEARELAAVRAKVDTMSQLVEQSVLQKRTDGDRLETVLTAASAPKPDERVIDGLINTMAFDPSVNVRLNALNGLYAHADQEVVRAGVLACLVRESNPLVQVSMIDFLVAAKAREAGPVLRKLAADDQVDADVRESARRAGELL